jgi:cyanophycinase
MSVDPGVVACSAAAAALAAVLTLCGCAAAERTEALGPDGAAAGGGHLMLIGGGAKPAEAMAGFVAVAGGAGARIVVLPMASGDSRNTGAYYVDLFAEHGVSGVQVIHIDDRRDALRRVHVDAVAAADGVWFSGGDQNRIAARVVDTPLHGALRQVLRRGGVIGGTSAGTACQSEVMITGEGDATDVRRGAVATTRGLGLWEGVIVDQHFLARQRQRRLLSLVLEHPRELGIGIDEGTAAWVRPDGTMQVIGASQIIVYDAHEATIFEEPDGRMRAEGLREHALSAGDELDLPTRQPRPGH